MSFWGKVRKTSTCWLWLGHIDENGRGRTGKSGGAGIAARVAWEKTNGPIPKGKCVCHRCDNPACVRPIHLFLGTKKQNSEDMTSKGRQSRGAHRPLSKLTDKGVIQLRNRRLAGESLADLAAEFGITRANVSMIVRNKRWKHVRAA